MVKENNKSMALYEMQANICHALSNPIRLYILDLLSSEEMTSSQLLDVLEIPKANLSQHLSVLKDAGILKTRKEGTFQVLSLAIPKIKDACQLVRGILLDRLNEEQKTMSELKKNLDNQVNSSNKMTSKKIAKKG
ncbi:MAG: metalloregulator ArsR/SmtB family transcription factor [Bacteriovorax sp.]|nr:metalloregulator ArsR/SmtB family transcription factor [Bacteriovorax sp.]